MGRLGLAPPCRVGELGPPDASHPGRIEGPKRRFSCQRPRPPLERNQPMTSKPRGIAARAGHWSARHRKTAIIGWLSVMILLAVFGGSLGQKTPTDAQKLDGESRQAASILEDAGFADKSGEMVLVQSKSKSANSAAFRATVKDVAKTVGKVPVVANVKTDTVSADKHSALVEFDLTGDPHTAIDRVQPTIDATKAVAARHPGFAVEQFGTASMTKQMDDANAKEEQASNLRSLYITLIILALTFGALVAA